MIEKEELILGLRAIRSRLCVYNINGKPISDNWGCDCKYGAHLFPKSRGENGSGCPEILKAIEILSKMDPIEYELILKRSILKDKNIPKGEVATCNDEFCNADYK